MAKRKPVKTGVHLGEWAVPEDVLDRVKSAVIRVFQDCADDLAASLEKGEKMTIGMATEVALDAGRPITMGGLSKEDWEKFSAIGYEAMDKMAADWLKPYV
jgi:hypothetical protein